MPDAQSDVRLKSRFGHAPAWVQYVAQDADGGLGGYEAAPNRADSGWYGNEVGHYVKLAQEPPDSERAATRLRLSP